MIRGRLVLTRKSSVGIEKTLKLFKKCKNVISDHFGISIRKFQVVLKNQNFIRKLRNCRKLIILDKIIQIRKIKIFIKKIEIHENLQFHQKK